MESPHEGEEFWELAEDIARTDIQTKAMSGQDNRTLACVFRSFFRIKPKTD